MSDNYSSAKFNNEKLRSCVWVPGSCQPTGLHGTSGAGAPTQSVFIAGRYLAFLNKPVFSKIFPSLNSVLLSHLKTVELPSHNALVGDPWMESWHAVLILLALCLNQLSAIVVIFLFVSFIFKCGMGALLFTWSVNAIHGLNETLSKKRADVHHSFTSICEVLQPFVFFYEYMNCKI